MTTPLAKGLANALTDVGVVLDNYLTDFETTVNQTGKDLDSDKLRSLQKDLANIRAMKKATVAAVSKSHINDHLPGGEMNPYSVGVSTAAFDNDIASDTKKIKILDLYDDFEGRHTTDYDTIMSALTSVETGIQTLNNPKNFNTTTGEFNPGNLNNAEWYQNLTNHNATKRDPAIDVKTIQTPIYGAAGNVVGYDKQYEVYIDGQLNPEAGQKLIELENKEGLKFVSGILGITDFLEAISGKDPFTGEKVTSQERAKAIFWTVLLAIPVGKAVTTLKNLRKGVILEETALKSVDEEFLTKVSKAVEEDSGVNVTSKYDDLYAYKYNGYANPGPLNEVRGQPNKNFYGGRYDIEVLKEQKIYYRSGDSTSPLGQWFTEIPPSSVADVRINLAVKPQWLDKNGALTGTSTIDTVYKVEIPAGTTIYKGPVGNQGEIYQGGLNNNQVFIQEPWLLDKVNILGKQPLK